jgi:hypothetical protein
MRSKYLLYPKALEKLQSSGLAKRVEELKKSEDGLPYIGGSIITSEIVDSVQYLKEHGFYKHFPKDFAAQYKKIMSGMIKDPKKFHWTIQRPEGKITEPCELEDMLLFSGDVASIILNPEEIWDYSKFGFSSSSELATIVGTYIMQQSHGNSFPEGYVWTRKNNDGSEILTEITGDHNGDLRIPQTDIAPYPTRDPFGNLIEMRPELNADRHSVAASYFTEATLLVAVMRYIEQQGIKAPYFNDGGKELVKWGSSLGQGGGSCTEHFGDCARNPMFFFIERNKTIPKLNTSNETDDFTPFWLDTEGDGSYGAYIANNGDFVLSYQDKEMMKKSVKPIDARFAPEDAEHLVKGLIYQCAKGLGRTSARQLLDIIQYRYSQKFEDDQKRFQQK